MKTTSSRMFKVAMMLPAMLLAVGCEDIIGKSELDTLKHRFHIYDINAYPLNALVCDPFGSTGQTSPQKGIKAELYYRSSGQPRYYSAVDYIANTTKLPETLFFTDMNVPTRSFDMGFSTQTNSVLKDDNGNLLIEYMALKMNTTIRLAPEDEEGVYEFAVLSDDGAIMKIKNGDNWTTVVNNDGDHPTRLGCSTEEITMTRDTKLETEFMYYQGPRYHIANILLWRKLDSSSATNNPINNPNTGMDPSNPEAGLDPKCGHEGNNFWFDPNHESRPKEQFEKLLERGWKVVKADNYYLPERDYNPCTPGTAPVIQNFRLSELSSTNAYLAWETDIPSTSQVLITEVATGKSLLTPTDNILRTSHYFEVPGLTTNTTYKIQAVSVSEDLGKTVSDPIEFTTP